LPARSSISALQKSQIPKEYEQTDDEEDRNDPEPSLPKPSLLGAARHRLPAQIPLASGAILRLIPNLSAAIGTPPSVTTETFQILVTWPFINHVLIISAT
jgi:hypothetical protein